MKEDSNFVMIGDERDIPMTLGLIIMVWNACELQSREILNTLASKAAYEHKRTVEPLISELGSVGITQGLSCYVHEFPDDERDLSSALAHAVQVTEICRAYRNYYIHQISGVTRYGFDFSPETIAKNPPVHEAMTVGPFAKVFSRTAKGKMKFSMHFIEPDELLKFNNYLAEFHEYLNKLHVAVIHYFRKDILLENREPAPHPLTLLNTLKKPEVGPLIQKGRPALAPWVLLDDDEDDNKQ